ncbi:signal transduction histidine kinase/ActR/RegA family two-component response regulator [Spirosoma lacussanchae]|uniref:hybrid sensor histidine kinase/response regulator n=1 Tax=Spirosoma lacussanchae TaxID=1884249 RepID=UPI001107FBDA|nr:ATP-binding protein [Spirosoma lacussanchae]
MLEDGSQRWMSGYGRITEERDSQPVRMSGVMFDVDERRRADDALRLADRRKDEFLAMLAHELRNPMATIRSGLNILTLTTAGDETTHSTVAMMNRQTAHLVRMVDDLLDVSRISRGKIELKKSRVNLVELVRQARQSIAAEFELQGKVLHIHLPSTPVDLEGDATRLIQVVANLLTNGLRYTGEDGQVWVSLIHQHQEAILQVRDNGIGLAKDQQSAIFELFVQVDNSVARSKGGLGLGLTLVKQLVEMHGGRVDVYSEGLGKGSTFTVHLPTLTTAAESSPMPAPQTTDSAAASRILVIDDNADAALMMTMLLKLKGYEAYSRTSGQAGLEAAERLQPAAILLDIGMPELDGYATCRLIREQAWGQGLAVIALTGYGQQEDRQRTREAGFDGHLVKPVDVDELTNLLTALLGKTPSG